MNLTELEEEVEQLLTELRANLEDAISYCYEDDEAARDLVNRKLLEFELEVTQ